ncbi:tRNA-intron lyase [Halobium salinum]|uniref:tRNA-splicing endonuclease n=1 Tax=Halobium salinum TaxID=1364940 RepID=A0ABD5PH52_9EURY|nr:tRNA-intron lyase [Halobium salinum]
MDGHLEDGVVHVDGDARQRFYDSRGYGRPLGGNRVALSRIEAAHLLFRGDLDSVDGEGFRAFFADSVAAGDRFALRFLVYKDLRGRGFYLAPARDSWPGPADDAAEGDAAVDLVVYPRGKGPTDGGVEHRVWVAGERETLDAASLLPDEGESSVLAVVDEESEISYFEASRGAPDGSVDYAAPGGVTGTLLEDRVLVWDPPGELYEHGFYGQPLSGRAVADAVGEGLQLSLVEAAALTAAGSLTLGDAGGDADSDAGTASADYDAVVARGREVEGDRFDRRLRGYVELRDRGVVPKTGFKFGADFRTYAELESVSELGHSEALVRVLPPEHTFAPRDLALDVRLAGGVRKRMVFALTGSNDGIDWLSVGRLTP